MPAFNSATGVLLPKSMRECVDTSSFSMEIDKIYFTHVTLATLAEHRNA